MRKNSGAPKFSLSVANQFQFWNRRYKSTKQLSSHLFWGWKSRILRNFVVFTYWLIFHPIQKSLEQKELRDLVFKGFFWMIFWYTVFPHIVSAETILFWLWPYVLWPLVTVHKSAETIQGRKLYEEIRYVKHTFSQ